MCTQPGMNFPDKKGCSLVRRVVSDEPDMDCHARVRKDDDVEYFFQEGEQTERCLPTNELGS